MLQVITGKFFTTDELYITPQRSVLYTNYALHLRDPIKTLVGSIAPVTIGLDDSKSDVAGLIYEYDERVEAVRPNGQKEFMVATNTDEIVQDFAAVLAFTLNVVCTSDISVVRQLTQSKHRSLGITCTPQEYVHRVFDQRVHYIQGDEEKLQTFITSLVGLERRRYKSVMRAIRRYVTGLHHIADDLDLAYALLVASIESLAQEFDNFSPKWEDYDQNKREKIDKSLKNVTHDTAEEIRNAILSNEHVSLARRYREFTLAHVRPSFFRNEAIEEVRPVRRIDLDEALEQAYKFRSKYVHTLRELPQELTVLASYGDTTLLLDGKHALTFHGLACIARHVIQDFINRSPKLERETFNYRDYLPNIIQARIAEQYWLWRADSYNHNTARRYLNGFLSQLSLVMSKQKDALLTDISDVIKKIEISIRGLKKPEHIRPMFALYLLFHRMLPTQYHLPHSEEFIERYGKYIETPSIESILIHVILNIKPDWKAGDAAKIYADYRKQRSHKNGIVFGSIFEAAVILFLADMYREESNEVRARELVSEAVEDLPGHKPLLDFEQTISNGPLLPIEWYKILLPPNDVEPQPHVAGPDAGPAPRSDLE